MTRYQRRHWLRGGFVSLPGGRIHVTNWRYSAVLLLAMIWCPLAVAQQGGLIVDSASCLLKPKQVVQLASPLFGLLAAVYVDRADTVKQGQVIAKLDTSVEEVQAALDHFRAANTTQIEADTLDLGWNQRELERRQKLVGNMFSKANDIDEYLTKVEQDRIAIRKAEADLHTAKLESARSDAQLALKVIKSPINGVVTEIKLSPGEYIYEQTPIMTIAEVDPLAVDLVVPADRYRSVRVGLIGELHLNAPVNATYPARVDAIDPVLDAASDTFRVRLTLPNPGNAIPAGTRCSAHLPDAEPGG